MDERAYMRNSDAMEEYSAPMEAMNHRRYVVQVSHAIDGHAIQARYRRYFANKYAMVDTIVSMVAMKSIVDAIEIRNLTALDGMTNMHSMIVTSMAVNVLRQHRYAMAYAIVYRERTNVMHYVVHILIRIHVYRNDRINNQTVTHISRSPTLDYYS